MHLVAKVNQFYADFEMLILSTLNP